ncbi:hypothetical protein MC885_003617 [Smutsia gigantea]|nr:hypothetical protein MC885_003617 [Smutsia gigantea]
MTFQPPAPGLGRRFLRSPRAASLWRPARPAPRPTEGAARPQRSPVRAPAPPRPALAARLAVQGSAAPGSLPPRLPSSPSHRLLGRGSSHKRSGGARARARGKCSDATRGAWTSAGGAKGAELPPGRLPISRRKRPSVPGSSRSSDRGEEPSLGSSARQNLLHPTPPPLGAPPGRQRKAGLGPSLQSG